MKSFPVDLIEKTIEDLRVYQEKPSRLYKNLQSTLRNWCAKEAEWRKEREVPSEDHEDLPVDELGRTKYEIAGAWYSEKEVNEFYRLGQIKRTVDRHGRMSKWQPTETFPKGEP